MRINELAANLYCDSTTGTKGTNVTSATEYVSGPLHKTVHTFIGETVTIADDTGVASTVAWGKVYEFPAGLILCLGCVIDGTITLGLPAPSPTPGAVVSPWARGRHHRGHPGGHGGHLHARGGCGFCHQQGGYRGCRQRGHRPHRERGPLGGRHRHGCGHYIKPVVDDSETHTAVPAP